jgi:hypothetical protein
MLKAAPGSEWPDHHVGGRNIVPHVQAALALAEELHSRFLSRGRGDRA